MGYDKEDVSWREAWEKLSNGFNSNSLLNRDPVVNRFDDDKGSVYYLVMPDLQFDVKHDLVNTDVEVSHARSIVYPQSNGRMIAKCFAVDNVNLLGHAAACTLAWTEAPFLAA